MIANHSDTISEVKLSTGPFTEGAVLTEEIFPGHDVASASHMAARLVLGEVVKPRESMTTATLLARVEKWRKAGAAVAAAMGAHPVTMYVIYANHVAARRGWPMNPNSLV